MRPTSPLGYAAAGLVLAAMAVAPFVLFAPLTRFVAGLGVHPHPRFAGGPVRQVLDRGAWMVSISAPAGPVGPLERGRRFVQVSWSPVEALPAHVEEVLDLDGDGRPDVRIAFDVPRDARAPLSGRLEVLDPSRAAGAGPLGRGGEDLSTLLARLEHRIVARVPLP